jgi:hypothetical protein
MHDKVLFYNMYLFDYLFSIMKAHEQIDIFDHKDKILFQYNSCKGNFSI